MDIGYNPNDEDSSISITHLKGNYNNKSKEIEFESTYNHEIPKGLSLIIEQNLKINLLLLSKDLKEKYLTKTNKLDSYSKLIKEKEKLIYKLENNGKEKTIRKSKNQQSSINFKF
jgi:hypothetical protein